MKPYSSTLRSPYKTPAKRRVVDTSTDPIVPKRARFSIATPSMHDDQSAEDSESDWDQGRTLIDSFKDVFGRDDQEEEMEKKLALVDQLQEPLDASAREVQRDLVEALVPTMDHIKLVHDLLHETVEAKLETALVTYDQHANEYQLSIAEHQNQLKAMLDESNRNLMKHFHTLKDEYAHRSQLLVDLRTDLEVLASDTRQIVEETAPVALEDVKSDMEKRLKLIGKADKGGRNQQEMMVRTLLKRR